MIIKQAPKHPAKAIFDAHQIPVKDLAYTVGVSRQHISCVLNGSSKGSKTLSDKLTAIAAGLEGKADQA